MGVMGRNLALNILDRGTSVAVYNREPEGTKAALEESAGRLRGTSGLEELVGALERPRRIMMMIKAGEPVDMVLGQLKPLLQPGDIVIDGGNSWYEDTRRREREYTEAGLNFFGVGVSGGEEGARNGPSLMPGGDKGAYEALKPVFEAIAARTDSGPCVTHVGPDGAGHFVKMVHNGIEYADMQFIAEAYHVLKDGSAASRPMPWPGCSQTGTRSARVVPDRDHGPDLPDVRDSGGEGFLVDQVLDKAGQKGTGPLDGAGRARALGVPVPSISAAIDAADPVQHEGRASEARAGQSCSGPSGPTGCDG